VERSLLRQLSTQGLEVDHERVDTFAGERKK